GSATFTMVPLVTVMKLARPTMATTHRSWARASLVRRAWGCATTSIVRGESLWRTRSPTIRVSATIANARDPPGGRTARRAARRYRRHSRGTCHVAILSVALQRCPGAVTACRERRPQRPRLPISLLYSGRPRGELKGDRPEHAQRAMYRSLIRV